MQFNQRYWSFFEDYLISIESSVNAFNPWRSVDLRYDLVGGDGIRRRNFKSYLSLFENSPRILAIGEAPGWRGCRFSGVPFTSEAQLVDEATPVEGRQSSSGSLHTETSARVIWSVLKSHARQVFLWNAFPIHPHAKDDSLSNRTPLVSELKAQEEFLKSLWILLEKPRVIAIGRKAEKVLSLCGLNPTYVRHPAFGGGPEFEKGMRQLLRKEGLL